MDFFERPYQAGDEVSINNLYEKITGRNRTLQQYKWEWLETWNGQGKIWLGFDRDRAKDDQLIMQYSLIPVPFCVFGESLLAGKTENCMSHPDCRGKKLYFPHEKKYFEKAKKEFQIFYTTAGDVANGTVGAVRRKLGYKAFDSWTTLFFINKSGEKLAPTFKDGDNFLKNFVVLMRRIVLTFLPYYFSVFQSRQFDTGIKILRENDAPLKEIEQLWEKNKNYYGITVERSAAYIDWRINKNPYIQHEYLTYWKDDKLKGYLIFYRKRGNILNIVDIFVENKEKKIFKKIIRNLIYFAKTNNIEKISCVTSSGNWFLRKIFYFCGFLTPFNIRRKIGLKDEKNLSQKLPFHTFISDSIVEKYPDVFKTQEWYMTGLVFEGILFD